MVMFVSIKCLYLRSSKLSFKVEPKVLLCVQCASLTGIQTELFMSLSFHRHCEMCRNGCFRAVGFCLKFHPSVFVVHSEGRGDKQVEMYKEIIPGPGFRRHPSIAQKLSANSGIRESRPFGLCDLDFILN